MVEGDKWELYIPSELAYGDRGRPPQIGGGDALVFTIELKSIKGARTPAKPRHAASVAPSPDEAKPAQINVESSQIEL